MWADHEVHEEILDRVAVKSLSATQAHMKSKALESALMRTASTSQRRRLQRRDRARQIRGSIHVARSGSERDLHVTHRVLGLLLVQAAVETKRGDLEGAVGVVAGCQIQEVLQTVALDLKQGGGGRVEARDATRDVVDICVYVGIQPRRG